MKTNFSSYKKDLNEVIDSCASMIKNDYEKFSMGILLFNLLNSKGIKSILEKDENKVKIDLIKSEIIKHENKFNIKLKKEDSKSYKLLLTEEVKDIIIASTAKANMRESKVIDTQDMMLSIIEYKNNIFIDDLLLKNGLNEKIFEKLNFEMGMEGLKKAKEGNKQLNNKKFFTEEDSPNEPPLEIRSFLKNLNTSKEVEDFKIVGREKEIEKVMQILNRKLKSNMILTGDSGVGKTSVAIGIAQRIKNGEAPKNLLNKVVYEVVASNLIAGTKYRGDFEERVNGIVEFSKQNKNVILFIDEINMLFSNGGERAQFDAANILKPALANGDLKCIGSSSYEEYKKIIAKDPSLSRRFQEVKIEESSEKESFLIIKGIIKGFEEHHNVKYTDDAINATITLSNKYLKEAFLPDKAIDLIDEAGSIKKSKDMDKESVEKSDIEELISKRLNIPLEKIQSKKSSVIKGLRENLSADIYGQDEAIKAIYQKMLVSQANLNPESKTEGSFLFLGPTGVGKTEIVNRLSKELGRELIRIDMSEYMDSNSVSKLIGAAPGYVGYESGGVLTNKVKKQPDSIILIDEIEKAHKDIQNIFLQILDNAELTDSKGDKFDFSRSLIVFTSNAGSSELQKNSMGFEKSNVKNAEAKKEVNLIFSPELRNRIDSIVTFNSLSKENIKKVLDKFVTPIIKRVKENFDVDVSITSAAKNWLIENGYDEKMGARPMTRIIEKEITAELAELLINGEIGKERKIKIGFKNNKITFLTS